MNKRKILAFITVLAVILNMLALSVSAADWSAVYTLTDNKLVLNGTGAIGGSLVSVFIIESTVSAETVNSSNPPEMADAVIAGADGTFSLTFIITNLTTGQYKLHVVNGANTWESTAFSYINNEELGALSENVSLAADAAAIKAALEPFQIVLQMPDLDYTSDYLFAVCPEGGYNEESFNNELQRSAALYLLSHGESAENLVLYEEYLKDNDLEINCYEQYINLNEDAKALYLEKIAEADLKTTSAIEDIYAIGLISSALNAQSWKDMQNIVCGGEDENKFFALKIADGTRYDDLEYPEVIFQKLYKQRSSLTDLETLIDKFDNIADDVYDDENKKDKHGSSGGGGGGGFVSTWGPAASQSISNAESKVEKPAEDKPEDQSHSLPANADFADIAGHWGESNIKELAKRGVVNGYTDGTFRPDNAVTRAEFVKLLCVLFGLESDFESTFKDVSSDDWFAPFVGAAEEAGLVKGDTNGCFNHSTPISRQDAAVILSRFLKLADGDATDKFTDSADIATYATGAVAAMYDNGFIKGMDNGSFSPRSETTRAQAATMLLNCKIWLDNGRGGGADK